MANLGLGIVFVAVPWLYIDLNAAGVLYFAWLASATLRPDGKESTTSKVNKGSLVEAPEISRGDTRDP